MDLLRARSLRAAPVSRVRLKDKINAKREPSEAVDPLIKDFTGTLRFICTLDEKRHLLIGPERLADRQ
jgi:hypothetical protein